jgi:hypothetical protein
MSKKDKSQNRVSDGSPVSLSAILKGFDGVTVSDDKRLRITAPDGKTLNERTETVVQKLGELGDVIVSPLYGNAAAIGCVWYDVRVDFKK